MVASGAPPIAAENGSGGRPFRQIDSPEPVPVNLLETAGAPVAKRLLPVGIAAAVLFILLMLRRRRR